MVRIVPQPKVVETPSAEIETETTEQDPVHPPYEPPQGQY
jgi:hypothetical protein